MRGGDLEAASANSGGSPRRTRSGGLLPAPQQRWLPYVPYLSGRSWVPPRWDNVLQAVRRAPAPHRNDRPGGRVTGVARGAACSHPASPDGFCGFLAAGQPFPEQRETTPAADAHSAEAAGRALLSGRPSPAPPATAGDPRGDRCPGEFRGVRWKPRVGVRSLRWDACPRRGPSGRDTGDLISLRVRSGAPLANPGAR